MDHTTIEPEAKITAIVVDDDYDTVLLLSECLELRGITVVGRGYDGIDATRLFHELKPDVIFLDIMMPHHNGFYAVNEIRRDYPNAHIIMVTADLTQETAKKIEELNLQWIYKPYELDDVISLVNKVMKKPSLQTMT